MNRSASRQAARERLRKSAARRKALEASARSRRAGAGAGGPPGIAAAEGTAAAVHVSRHGSISIDYPGGMTAEQQRKVVSMATGQRSTRRAPAPAARSPERESTKYVEGDDEATQAAASPGSSAPLVSSGFLASSRQQWQLEALALAKQRVEAKLEHQFAAEISYYRKQAANAIAKERESANRLKRVQHEVAGVIQEARQAMELANGQHSLNIETMAREKQIAIVGRMEAEQRVQELEDVLSEEVAKQGNVLSEAMEMHAKLQAMHAEREAEHATMSNALQSTLGAQIEASRMAGECSVIYHVTCYANRAHNLTRSPSHL